MCTQFSEVMMIFDVSMYHRNGCLNITELHVSSYLNVSLYCGMVCVKLLRIGMRQRSKIDIRQMIMD